METISETAAADPHAGPSEVAQHREDASAVMKILTGLTPPDAGRAEILGLNCWARAQELRHRVGYMPERPRFYDWMTVTEIGWFAKGSGMARFVDAQGRALKFARPSYSHF